MSSPHSTPPGSAPPADVDPSAEAEQNRWFAAEVQPHAVALRRWLQARFPKLDTDDLVQESFLRILRARATSSIAHPKAYLFNIARNFALNQIRHGRHEHRDSLGENGASDVLDDRPGIPETLARSQERELLIQALQCLPERARQVFTLRRVYGLPLKEICSRLGIAEKTAEAHISLALRRCADYVQNADARARRAAGGSQATPNAAVTPRSFRHV